MSTRLEKAERAAKAKQIKPAFHRQIIIEERNKEIFALKEKKRKADDNLRWALAALDLVYNGLKSRGLQDAKTPTGGDTEMWNLRVVKVSIESALK